MFKILSAMSEEVRQEHFCKRDQLLSQNHKHKQIWAEGELGQLHEPRHGKQILPDKVLNEIFSDACIRHTLGVSFSPRTLKLRINEVEDYCLKHGVTMPSARAIRNYIALLKSIG